jgi:hypothetical protein
MAEEQKRGPGRPRKEQGEPVQQSDFEARRQELKGQEGVAAGLAMGRLGLDEQHQREVDLDERLEDRRPGTLKDPETGEPFPDNRRYPGDIGKAANQMAGRAFITENASPHPYLDDPLRQVPGGPIPRASTMELGGQEDDGEEIVLLKGIMATELTKHQPGTIIRRPRKEAKDLVNRGVAKFTEND